MQCALVLLCYIFRKWNALWRYNIILSAHGTHSGVLVLYFLRVECAMIICVEFFSCCIILTFFFCVYFKNVEV